ncbi:hypothetical protein LGQ02_14075 [Bacillus shivajii]|uniref:hypothetical protein n=1 Tax=Bacillus shivajii TaxID=1983719 RepID=UPI001CFB8B58|nr:hypothetical protein [Bacillus shivajii]UCZ51973.1 hypothetical protein LGQ02_14075 [Bacillus shivajii]
MKLVYGLIIFSLITIFSYIVLFQIFGLNTGISLIIALLFGGLTEWLFYRRKR